ncbi:NUDIX domain-containing protein [Candidatus Woesebacteria bacterium]|nr:NUDIX domain-containing protein [Candidatus Woesebacteria bacterium]
MSKFDQNVLCIKAEKLFSDGKWDGLKTDNLDTIYRRLVQDSEFRRRGDLEEDPNFKQIIPQVVLRHNGRYFLHVQRSGSEERLQNLAPLPLGGHVEEFDIDGEDNLEDLIQRALYRELEEEADVKSTIEETEFLGLIYIEDDNPVNHVHVGLAYIFDLDGKDVPIKEKELEEIGFVDLAYLQENIKSLTYWSRIIVEELTNRTNAQTI